MAQRLRAALEDLEGVAVAKACGVSKQAVTNWKKDGRIDKKHLPTLSKLTGLPIEYWLGMNPEEAQHPLEAELLLVFRALSEDGKSLVLNEAKATYLKQYHEVSRPYLATHEPTAQHHPRRK